MPPVRRSSTPPILGGVQVDDGERIAVDAGGNAYAMGFTSSTDFPTTAGAFDTTANGAFDVFVTKLNPAGSALLYSTYLGGAGFDSGGGLTVDAAGNAYVAGGTGSTDFPTTPGAFNTVPDGSDAFVTKLNPAGSALAYSAVFGGTASEGANGIALDAAGQCLGDWRHQLRRFSCHRRGGRQLVQRHGGRLRLRVERQRFGAALLDLSRGNAVGERQRRRARFGRRRLRHGPHLLDGLPRHDGRLRHDLQWRHVDFLGRRLRGEDCDGRGQLDASGAARRYRPRPACRRPSTARAPRSPSASTGATCRAPCRTRCRWTTRARSARRSCAT